MPSSLKQFEVKYQNLFSYTKGPYTYTFLAVADIFLDVMHRFY